MRFTESEITYLLKLISEDDATPEQPRRLLSRRLEQMRDDTRESLRLLQKLERIELEHRQMLEIIEQERQLILK